MSVPQQRKRGITTRRRVAEHLDKQDRKIYSTYAKSRRPKLERGEESKNFPFSGTKGGYL